MRMEYSKAGVLVDFYIFYTFATQNFIEKFQKLTDHDSFRFCTRFSTIETLVSANFLLQRYKVYNDRCH